MSVNDVYTVHVGDMSHEPDYHAMKARFGPAVREAANQLKLGNAYCPLCHAHMDRIRGSMRYGRVLVVLEEAAPSLELLAFLVCSGCATRIGSRAAILDTIAPYLNAMFPDIELRDAPDPDTKPKLNAKAQAAVDALWASLGVRPPPR